MKKTKLKYFQKFKKLIVNHPKKSIFGLVFFVFYYFSLPNVLFEVPYSTVILSKEGSLLDAKIAKDGQWRFPAQDSLPENYKTLPPLRYDCLQNQKAQMDFIYPKAGTKIILTKNFDSKTQPVIIKVAHSQKDIKLFWYLDEKYLGSTQHFHDMPIQAKTGTYFLSVTDENGNEIKRRKEIVRE